MANELHTIRDQEYYKYGYQFRINGAPFVIYLELTDDPTAGTAGKWDDDDKDPDGYALKLAYMVEDGAFYKAAQLAKTSDGVWITSGISFGYYRQLIEGGMSITEAAVHLYSDFLAKVKMFIHDQTEEGDVPDVELPEDATMTEVLLDLLKSPHKKVDREIQVNLI